MLVLSRTSVALSVIALAAVASAQIMSVNPTLVEVTATGGTYFTTDNRNAQTQWKSQTTQNAAFAPLPGVTEGGAAQPKEFWKTQKSWTMSYSESTRALVYTVYGTADWTGAIAYTYTMTMGNPTGGQRLVGLQLYQQRDASPSYGSTTVATTGTQVRLNSDVAWTAIPELSNSLTYTMPAPGNYTGPIVYFAHWKSSFQLRGIGQLNHGSNAASGNSLRNEIRAIYGTQRPAPEPASLAVLGIGLAALRRRKRR